MDKDDAKIISDQIARIDSLSKDLLLTLSTIEKPHAAFGVLLIELNWLGIKLAEIKKRLK
jgi:hypothetical protein